MSRSLSLRDLQLVPELAHMNEVTIIHPSNDDLVFYHLDKLGFDCDYAVEYLPSNHRCMRGKVAVGYRVVGELQVNRAFVNSVMCSTVERVAISSYQDRSLTQELAVLMNNTLDFNSFHESSIDEEDDSVFEDQLQPDRDYVGQQIQQLIDIRDRLRGSPYDNAGNPRTREQVKAWYAAQQKGLND